MLLVIAQGQWTQPLGFPGVSDGKEFACIVGDQGSMPVWEDPLKEDVATHCIPPLY